MAKKIIIYRGRQQDLNPLLSDGLLVCIVCILGYNAPEWVISNLAAVHARGFAAGIYQVRVGQCAISTR